MFKSARTYIKRRNDLRFFSKLKPIPPSERPFISFATAFRNRFEHLNTTFPENLKSVRDYKNFQFVLVNYGCPDPRTEEWAKTTLPPLIERGEVAYYRLLDLEKFHFAHARNVGLTLSSGSLYCNVDADNFVGERFADYLAARMAKSDCFVRLASGQRGAKGRICVRVKDAKMVGGYDERFEAWGADDGDLAERLQRSGKRQVTCYIPQFGRVLEHNDELRTIENGVSIGDAHEFSNQNRTYNRLNKTIKVENPKRNVQVVKNFSEKFILEC